MFFSFSKRGANSTSVIVCVPSPFRFVPIVSPFAFFIVHHQQQRLQEREGGILLRSSLLLLFSLSPSPSLSLFVLVHFGEGRGEMDLDAWISKVKEGDHLFENELQLLCEYVSFSFCLFPSVPPPPPLSLVVDWSIEL